MSNRHDHARRIEKAGALAPAFSFTPIDLLGLQKIQQVLIQLFLMCIRQSGRVDRRHRERPESAHQISPGLL